MFLLFMGIVLLAGAHELLIVRLAQRSLPYTYLIGAGCFLPPALLTLRKSRESSGRVSLLWALWSAALALEAGELLVGSVVNMTSVSPLWHAVPALCESASFCLFLMMVAIPVQGSASRTLRAIDLGMVGALCLLCWAAFLLPHAFGGVDSVWFLTALRAFAWVTALLATRAAADGTQFRILRWLAIYQFLDLVGTLITNQVMGVWLHAYGATRLDWVMDCAPLALASLLWLGQEAPFQRHRRSRYMAASALALLFSVTVMGMGIWLAAVGQRWAGGLGIAAALIGYGARSLLLHSRSLEVEDNFRSSLRQLRTLAHRDPLTSAGNRRSFERKLQQACAVIGEPVALLLLDIDHFKSINDSHGHVYGDECLQQVAEVLLRCTAGGLGHVARFGGDEFAVIFPGLDGDDAHETAERICGSVRALALSSYAGAHLTVTVGVAAVVSRGSRSRDELIRAADESLYRGKRAGRNRVGSGAYLSLVPAVPEAVTMSAYAD